MCVLEVYGLYVEGMYILIMTAVGNELVICLFVVFSAT